MIGAYRNVADTVRSKSDIPGPRRFRVLHRVRLHGWLHPTWSAHVHAIYIFWSVRDFSSDVSKSPSSSARNGASEQFLLRLIPGESKGLFTGVIPMNNANTPTPLGTLISAQAAWTTRVIVHQ